MANATEIFPNITKIKKINNVEFDTKLLNCPQCTTGKNEKVKYKKEFVTCNDREQIHIFHCEKYDVDIWMCNKFTISKNMNLTNKGDI